MSHHCDSDLKDSKAICLQVSPAYDDASQYKVWLQQVQQFRSIVQTFIEILNICHELDHDLINPVCFTGHFGLYSRTTKPNLVAKESAARKSKKNSQVLITFKKPSL